MATKQTVEVIEGYAKDLAPSDVVVPAGCMCLETTRGPQWNTGCGQVVLVGVLELEEGVLTGNLLVSTAYVKMQGGQILIPVLNVGTMDTCLQPHTRIAHIYAAEVGVGAGTVHFQDVGPQEVQVSIGFDEHSVSIQGAENSNLQQFTCPGLSEQQVGQARALLSEYADVSS